MLLFLVVEVGVGVYTVLFRCFVVCVGRFTGITGSFVQSLVRLGTYLSLTVGVVLQRRHSCLHEFDDVGVASDNCDGGGTNKT